MVDNATIDMYLRINSLMAVEWTLTDSIINLTLKIFLASILEKNISKQLL